MGSAPEALRGIEIPEDDRLPLGSFCDLYRLLRAIQEAIPPGAILYVEGTTIAPEVRDLLAEREIEPDVQPTLGTICPTPARFHFPLVSGNLGDLRRLAERHAEPEVCDHLVVYAGEDVLLDAYDAGDGDVHVNRRHLAPDQINRLRDVLGPPTGTA
jgi:hypothetical protein